MSYLLTLLAAVYLATGMLAEAQVVAVLALTFAVLRLRPGPLGRMWQDALRREQQADATLFEGRRDD